MASKTISVILGYVDRFTSPLKKSAKQIKETNQSIKDSTEKIKQLKQQILSKADIAKLATKEEKASARAANAGLREQIANERELKREREESLRVQTKQYKLQEQQAAKSRMARVKASETAKSYVAAAAKALLLRDAVNMVVDGVKTGFTAGAELETLRANIETVTKSAERASEVMKYAVNMANFSAFDNAELIESAAMLETYGLKTEKYLRSIGDAAAINKRDVADMAKAFGKAAVSGQFDSLADIGITRDTLNQYAQSKGIKLFSGTKILDKDVFADTLAEFMDSRYAGGMKKQASTLTGMWSTVKGIATNTITNIIGVSNDGSIKIGGAMDRIREKVQGVMSKMEQWEQDGTMKRIADRASEVFGWMLDAGEKLIDTITILGKSEAIKGLLNIAGVLLRALGPILDVVNTILKIILTINELSPWNAVPNFLKNGISDGDWSFNNPKEVIDKYWSNAPIPSYAGGTSRHPGGLARINERGGEIVDLPNGTRVIPAQQTRNILRGGNTIQIFISGAQRSDEELAEIVAERVLEAVENT